MATLRNVLKQNHNTNYARIIPYQYTLRVMKEIASFWTAFRFLGTYMCGRPWVQVSSVIDKGLNADIPECIQQWSNCSCCPLSAEEQQVGGEDSPAQQTTGFQASSKRLSVSTVYCKHQQEFTNSWYQYSQSFAWADVLTEHNKYFAPTNLTNGRKTSDVQPWLTHYMSTFCMLSLQAMATGQNLASKCTFP